MSIRLKLTITCLALALAPLLFLSLVTFHSYKNSLEDVRLSQLRDIAAYKADKIETYISGVKTDMRISRSFYNIRKNLPVLNAFSHAPSGPEFLAAKKQLDSQLRPMQTVKRLDAIMLVNPGGKIVYTSEPGQFRKQFLKDLPGPRQEIFAEGKKGIYVSDAFLDITGDGKPSMLVAAPAADTDNVFCGLIIFELDLAPIYGLVRDKTGLGETGEIILGKKRAGMVEYLNSLRYDPEAAFKLAAAIGGASGLPIQKAVQGETGSGLSVDYHGANVIAAWRHLPSLDWGMVVKIDAAEAFAAVTSLKKLLVLLVLLIAALAGITAFSVAQSLATPIKKLSEGTAIIGSGNFDHKVGTARKDEIGHLSRAFDAMTSMLKATTASRDELTKEIAERKKIEAVLRESESRVRTKIESIISPQADVTDLELIDVIDDRAIQELMDNFNALVRMPMAIIDLKGRVLVGVGWQKICTKFHRTNPETCAYCVESDTQLSADVRPGEFKIYKCKNGLTDVSTPIMIGGKHVGNLFIGQFFLQEDPPDREFFRTQARRYGFDEKKYLDAFDRIPLVSRESLDATMGFFLKLAHMISRLSFNNLKLARAMTQLGNLTGSLRESEKRLNKAQEMAHLGSWELDLGSNRLSWSDEVYRIFGLKPQEFAATYEAFLAAVHPDDRAAVDEAYSGSLRDGRDSYAIEHRVLRRGTREVRIVQERCAHIRGAAGAVIRSVGMVQDITDLKKAEEELRRSNENLEQFAYVASHDLQEPLRMMASYSELLERRYKDKLDADADEFIAYIVDGAKRLQKLINDLLAYSRIGRADKAMYGLDCNAVLSRVLAGMNHAITGSGAVVTSDPLPAALTGNESLFTQLFQNLIGNAIKFHGDEPPRVHIAAVRKDGDWLFSVKDNGIGIDPRYKDRIFIIFQRLHGRGDYPGTGIGLSICKRIVETHGGRIWPESEPGKGSTFYFTIPVIPGRT